MSSFARLWKEDTWVKPFFGRYRKTLVASLLLGIGALVFAVGLMFTSGYLISDAAEQPNLGVYALFGVLGFVQIFGIVKPFLTYYERLTSHDWVLRMTSSLRVGLFNNAERQGVFYTATNRMGDTLGLLSGDIGHVQNLYLRTVFPLVTAWALLAIVVVCLGAFDLFFALGMLLALGVLCFLFPLVSVLVNGARQTRAKQLSNETYTVAYDGVAGVADWVFSQRREDFKRSIMSLDAASAQVEAKSARFSRGRDLVAQVVFCACSLAILAWAAMRFGDISQQVAAMGFDARPADWIAAFVLGFFPLMEAFAPLSDAAVQANAHLDSVERLNALGDARDFMPNEQADRQSSHQAKRSLVQHQSGEDSPDESTLCEDAPGENAQSEGAQRETSAKGESASREGAKNEGAPDESAPGENAQSEDSQSETSALPADCSFSLSHVTFRYGPTTRTLLDGVDLNIPTGQRIAILGPSGAGKSTLLALLRGDLTPTSGSVTLGGVPTSEMGDAISDYIGVIQQETYLFNQTLLSNLRMGDASITPEQAQDALRDVGLGELLDRLPQGIRTVVDEAGLRFSGGERHRIALARVLLRDTPIVVLDEPMAALDEATERALLDVMLEKLAGRTIIMVTHHLVGVEKMDRVLFLRDGRIHIDGAPADLAHENAYYQQLLALDRGVL